MEYKKFVEVELKEASEAFVNVCANRTDPKQTVLKIADKIVVKVSNSTYLDNNVAVGCH